ncbi:WD domain, G-beta repeat-containing protein [Toxoplasma gondii TgCatPRC2]|uniref:WD domain, G-beta repeat-containing protein n=2 Tax=Toxoplasma gondii TaxID=5811 RepID=A0A151HNJ4_TOXGO|nr:WD domain, G-beta repeat-containing protein [Toxoplasma gondii ARI]KYK70967.1 WD domain, G-beta repeat-containing protein [Toxoplasma gondii TgCatPRC2]
MPPGVAMEQPRGLVAGGVSPWEGRRSRAALPCTQQSADEIASSSAAKGRSGSRDATSDAAKKSRKSVKREDAHASAFAPAPTPAAAGNRSAREGSVLFHPVRMLGKVTEAVPFGLARLGTEHFITCSTGRAFQVFEGEKLRLVFSSPPLGHKIRHMAVHHSTVYTAGKYEVFGWEKLEKVAEFLPAKHAHRAVPDAPEFKLRGLLVLGEWLLTFSGVELCVWNRLSGELVRRCENRDFFASAAAAKRRLPLFTALVHPPTYLNKVLVGFDSGALLLLNLRTGQVVHQLKCLDTSAPDAGEGVQARRAGTGSEVSDSEEDNSSAARVFASLASSASSAWGAVTVAALSPEPDVVAVGFLSGRIAVVDLRRDELLLEFAHSPAQGPVLALAFRNDAFASQASVDAADMRAVLVSGAKNGDLVVWSLDGGRFLGSLDNAHEGPIRSLQFYAGQPILVSSGEDNSLVMWIFDQPTGLPRELKSRRGHIGPVGFMSFYDGIQEGTELLTTSTLRGCGRVARTSLIRHQQNCVFSAKCFRKKAIEWGFRSKRFPPAVTDIAFASSRHFDWPNVVSLHRGAHAALVWSFHEKTLTPTALRVSRHASTPATAVAVSGCGNFVVVGYADGSLHRFNLQSGKHRGAFAGPRTRSHGTGAATPAGIQRAICAVAILHSSTVVAASSHPSDVALSLYSLTTHAFERRLQLPTSRGPIASFVVSPNSSLLAVSTQEGAVFLVDILSHTVIRTIYKEGAPAAPSAIAFSPDARWLAVASRPGASQGPTLYIYDILSATVIDWMRFKSPVLALTFDPTGTFLLTSHEHAHGGVFVWANKHAFDPALTAPLLHASPLEPLDVEDPVVEVAGEGTEGDTETQEAAEPSRSSLLYKTKRAPLFSGAFTLSSVPPAKLQAIVSIEEIKEKCKPVEPVAAPVSAPFFLPTRYEGTQAKFAPAEESASSDGEATGLGEDAVAFFSGKKGTQGEDEKKPRQKIFDNGRLDVRSELQKLLAVSEAESPKAKEERYLQILKYLKSLSPSGVSLAVHQIGMLAGGSDQEIEEMVRVFHYHVKRRHEADLVQSLLNVFLKAHGDVLLSAAPDSALAALVADLERLLRGDWQTLEEQFALLQCHLKFLTHLQME